MESRLLSRFIFLLLGIGQVGKAFRNEISPGQFLFRTREFEQMELQYFCDPQEADEWYSKSSFLSLPHFI